MKTVYIDMDGVLCDFMGGLLAAHNRLDLLERHNNQEFPKTWNVENELGSMDELWKPVNDMGEEFWTGIDPLPYMGRIIVTVRSLTDNWYIATNPGWHNASYSGKKKWLEINLPEVHKNRVILIKDKHLLASPNSLLIDDCDENINQFHAHKGKVFTFPQSWNQARDCIGEEVALLEMAVEDFVASPAYVPTYMPKAEYV